jgi:hypothetical protein
LGLIVAGWKYRRLIPRAELPPPPQPWKAIFWVFYLAFGAVYLVNALAPEASPDGAVYHLGFLAQYYRQHGFGAITTSMFANFPQGLGMLFFMAYPFAKHSAMVHALFLFSLPIGMAAYGRRVGLPAAGVTGGVLFFMIPVVGRDGTSAYVDVGLAAVLFACFYLLEVWELERKPALLVPIGLLAGFAYAVKYTGGPAIVYVIIYILWRLRHHPAVAFQSAGLAGLPALAMILPWVLKNIILVDNPFSPLANDWFPNTYIHPSLEIEYRRMMAVDFDVPLRQLPAEVCWRGEKLHGLLRPVFLASWISVAALANIHGRRLLAATALCALPFLHTPELRYLIPALPFFSLAFGMALSWRPWLAIAVLSLQAALSWPTIMSRYCGQYAWRIREIPWKVAFRIAPEGPYVSSWLGDAYVMAVEARKVMARGETVLALNSFPRSYMDQNVIVAWESAFGERMRDALYCAMFFDTQPTRRWIYVFQERTLRRIRLVQKARSGTQHWSISELRFYAGEKELSRTGEWRLKAKPNEWDAALAFDRIPVTRWSTWRPFAPEMFYEIDFGAPLTIDRVVADGTPEQSDIKVRVETWSDSGWSDVGVDPRIEDIPFETGWRRAAIQELKANGLKWMLVARSDWGAEDLHANAALWGIRPRVATSNHTLFYLE